MIIEDGGEGIGAFYIDSGEGKFINEETSTYAI